MGRSPRCIGTIAIRPPCRTFKMAALRPHLDVLDAQPSPLAVEATKEVVRAHEHLIAQMCAISKGKSCLCVRL